MQAALNLVTERGTTAVSVSDIAAEADLTRAVLYQQFGDRDTLLLETALDLLRRELLGRFTPTPTTSDAGPTLAMARHFASHRTFYRAVITHAGGYTFIQALTRLLHAGNHDLVRRLYPQLDEATVDDLTSFLTGGATAIITTWIVESPDPLEPDHLTHRLAQLLHVFHVPSGGLPPERL